MPKSPSADIDAWEALVRDGVASRLGREGTTLRLRMRLQDPATHPLPLGA